MNTVVSVDLNMLVENLVDICEYVGLSRLSYGPILKHLAQDQLASLDERGGGATEREFWIGTLQRGKQLGDFFYVADAQRS